MSTRPTALVTGAGRGIGRACARALGALGWRLALFSRDKRQLEAVAVGLPGGGHRAIAADLVEESGRLELFEAFDADPPDVIVQCLGGRISSEAADPWREAMQLNFHAVVAIDEHFLPKMIERGSGTIVHLSSSAAVHGRASAPYCCAKAALNRYIVDRGRACLPRGVICSGLMPAAVEGDDNYWARKKITDPARYRGMSQGQAFGRAQTTDEIAAVVAHMCSPAGKVYGGCVISVDAGAAG